MGRRFKMWLFDIIRRLSDKNYDSNEDFTCVECGRPVFRRKLFCSVRCQVKCNGLDW
jgi:hypothetical protein